MEEEDMSEEIEIEEEKRKRGGHFKGYLKDEEFLPIPFEEELERGEEEQLKSKVRLTRALMKEIVRRRTMMKIIKFLYKTNDSWYTKQIAHALDMSADAIRTNLQRLVKAGVVSASTPTPIDLVTKYYQLALDREIAEKIIKRYHWLVSFKLAKKLLSEKTVTIKDLKSNLAFHKLLWFYGLTVDEAIESLKKNKRVEAVYEGGYYRGDKKLIGFRRKKEEYITINPPTKPAKEDVEEVQLEVERADNGTKGHKEK